MMICLTGTPGTGKSSLANELSRRGHRVISLVDTTDPYIIGRDERRDTTVIDEERWAREFSPVEGIVEGHLAHFLPCDRVVILRCRPDILARRLTGRGYPEEKIKENAEAEALDVILQETVGRFQGNQIYEIDTTFLVISEVADIVEQVIAGSASASYGTIDWSVYLQGIR